jgi:hypothetical protein
MPALGSEGLTQAVSSEVASADDILGGLESKMGSGERGGMWWKMSGSERNFGVESVCHYLFALPFTVT